MSSLGNILVVENNDEIRAFITETLDEEGYTVRSASDREAMYSALDTQQPDLLICDLDFDRGPDLTLIDDLRALRAAAVPLIVMTTNTWISQSLARQGFTYCLLKPFHFNDLLTCVATHIRSLGSVNSASLRERAVGT
jgi:DNA-binding response OmpR family regulator